MTTATIRPAALKKFQGVSALARSHTLTYVRPFQILQNNEPGSEKFRQELPAAAAAERFGASHDGADRRETGEEKAGRIAREEPRRRSRKEVMSQFVVASSLRLEIGAQRRHYNNQISPHLERS